MSRMPTTQIKSRRPDAYNRRDAFALSRWRDRLHAQVRAGCEIIGWLANQPFRHLFGNLLPLIRWSIQCHTIHRLDPQLGFQFGRQLRARPLQVIRGSVRTTERDNLRDRIARRLHTGICWGLLWEARSAPPFYVVDDALFPSFWATDRMVALRDLMGRRLRLDFTKPRLPVRRQLPDRHPESALWDDPIDRTRRIRDRADSPSPIPDTEIGCVAGRLGVEGPYRLIWRLVAAREIGSPFTQPNTSPQLCQNAIGRLATICQNEILQLREILRTPDLYRRLE